MRNKKGFTLIELLAVIVILAVIMVIAVPKILDIIENSRKSAFENSYKLVTSAIKTQLASSNLVGTNFEKNDDGCYLFDFTNNNNNVQNLKVKNKETFTGSISYCDNKISYNKFTDGNYIIDKDIVYKNGEVACDYKKGTEWVFDYTGNEQDFKAPCDANYKIELWGASGGGGAILTSLESYGGNGGYVSGEIKLSKDKQLYIYVGGEGIKSTTSNSPSSKTFYWDNGGWNGGGSTYGLGTGTGGGSTDISLIRSDVILNDKAMYVRSSESLASRIMVAGGGGGTSDHGLAGSGSSAYTVYLGGHGGNLLGGRGYGTHGGTANCFLDRNCIGTGGTQISGGTTTNESGKYVEGKTNYGQFGSGGYGYGRDYHQNYGVASGGGAGYYGGAGTYGPEGAGGGSSYISGHVGAVAIKSQDDITPKDGCTDGTTNIECSYHYSGLKFKNTTMSSGGEEMPTHDGTSKMTGNKGNGYAKITLISY